METRPAVRDVDARSDLPPSTPSDGIPALPVECDVTPVQTTRRSVHKRTGARFRPFYNVIKGWCAMSVSMLNRMFVAAAVISAVSFVGTSVPTNAQPQPQQDPKQQEQKKQQEAQKRQQKPRQDPQAQPQKPQQQRPPQQQAQPRKPPPPQQAAQPQRPQQQRPPQQQAQPRRRRRRHSSRRSRGRCNSVCHSSSSNSVSVSSSNGWCSMVISWISSSVWRHSRPCSCSDRSVWRSTIFSSSTSRACVSSS